VGAPILNLIHNWTYDASQDQMRFEVGIGSHHTSVDWYMFCREICYEHLEMSADMLGGPGKIVEVDEAKFGKRSTTEDEESVVFGFLVLLNVIQILLNAVSFLLSTELKHRS
jgi:hypothetical protein